MRTCIFTLFLVLGFGALQAQISINETDNTPSPVDSFEYQVVSSPPNMTDLIEKTGSNKTWDMSSLSGSPVTYDILSPSAGQKTSDYPNSSKLEFTNNNSSETYFISNSSEWSQEGSYIPSTVQVIYNDPRQFLSFPMTYNDMFTDAFSGTVENIAAGVTYDRYGSNESVADGYGKLILPYDTVENVLRVRNVGSYQDTNSSGMVIGNYQDTIITFYNTATDHRIASMTSLYANGSRQSYQASYLSQSDLAMTLGKEQEGEEVSMEVRPNPAREAFKLSLPRQAGSIEGEEVRIVDITGKVVERFDPKHSMESVDISDLESGVYLVHYESELGRSTQKLMVN